MTQQHKDGYAITTLYDLGAWDDRARFDAFRQARGLAPYFSDDVYGENLAADRFFVDQADTDALDQAFLAGADVGKCDGIRIPWKQDTEVLISRHPLYRLIQEHELPHTIWPSSHAFIALDRQILDFYATVVRNTELGS